MNRVAEALNVTLAELFQGLEEGKLEPPFGRANLNHEPRINAVQALMRVLFRVERPDTLSRPVRS